MARRRPSTRFCSASSQSPSSSRSSSCGTSFATCSPSAAIERLERTRLSTEQMPAVHCDGLGRNVCAGPVTPSTGPAHTSFRGRLVRRREPPFRKWRISGTMSRITTSPAAVARGRETALMHQLDRSDRSSDDLVRRRDTICGAPSPDRESGQATVEFALILLPAADRRRGDHLLRHRPQLLARHEPRRQPGRALRDREQLARSVPATGDYASQPSTYCDDIEANCAATLATNSMASLQEVLRCSTRNNAAREHLLSRQDAWPRQLQAIP